MGHTLDFVVDLVEQRVDQGEPQFSESTLEQWYFACASQQNVAVLEFGSSCPSRLPLFSNVLSRSVLSPTLNVSLSWTERVWELSVSITSILVLSCVFSTLGSLLSSDERAWITLVSTTGLSVLSEETVFFVKRINRSLENGTLLFHVAPEALGFAEDWIIKIFRSEWQPWTSPFSGRSRIYSDDASVFRVCSSSRSESDAMLSADSQAEHVIDWSATANCSTSISSM